jgi:hypothetical protein
MTSYVLRPDGERRRVGTSPVLRLGLFHYWLLVGVLGGMIALVLLVFLAQLQTK